MTNEQREKYLEIAGRLAKPGSGSSARVLREATSHYGVPRLDFLRGKVPFVVVGGLATSLYMPERMTLDTDILVRLEDMPDAENALQAAGYSKQGSLTTGGSTWLSPNGRPLDLLSFDEPWVDDAVNSPIIRDGDVPYIALQYLVLMKLYSGRLQDLADIGRMLGRADDETLETVRNTIHQYMPQETADLESIISLGKLEYEGQ